MTNKQYRVAFISDDGFDLCNDTGCETRRDAILRAKQWCRPEHARDLEMIPDQFAECRVKVWVKTENQEWDNAQVIWDSATTTR